MEIVQNEENYTVMAKDIPDTLNPAQGVAGIYSQPYKIYICFSYLTPIAYYNSQEGVVYYSNNVTSRDSIKHLHNFCGTRDKTSTAQVNIQKFVDSL